MDVFQCITKRNSVRLFTQERITSNDLIQIIDAVRVMPSAANLQPLEYIIVNTQEQCDAIFPTISWASYITPPWSPLDENRPTAYIAILNTQPENRYADFDSGIAMAYIVLAAQALDIGSCILCNINREKLHTILNIPQSIQLVALVALGKKQEVIKRVEEVNQVKYWRDKYQVFHVPKKPLSSILHEQKFREL